MNSLNERWANIQEKIGPKKVTVVAVSKKQTLASIEEAYAAGIRNFGENYVQEALPKIDHMKQKNMDVTWHFVGALQTNKMNKIIPRVDCVHAIGSISQIEKLNKMAVLGEKLPKILVQLNLASEETKQGLVEKEIEAFMIWVNQNTSVEVAGLMTFPPFHANPEKNRIYFEKARLWKERINALRLARIDIRELSMGISNDFEVAIQEGATMVRLGEALFGSRQKS